MATKSNGGNENRNVITPIGIATFVHLFEPHTFKSKRPTDKPKDPMYSVMLVFTEDQAEELKPLKRACQKAFIAKFGQEQYESLLKKKKIRWPWRDAAEYEDEYGEPFVDGNVMINFKTNPKNQPEVVDKSARPIMKRSDVYPGCQMRVSAYPWPYDTDGSYGVTLLLNNAQKCGEGEKLAGGRASASDEFDAVDGDDDDDTDPDFDDPDDEPAPRKKPSAGKGRASSVL